MKTTLKNSPVVKKEKVRKSSKDKKKQLQLTNQWLDENYCVCDGVCIPRCILYSQYLDFCQVHSLPPACAATFGKIIRQKFRNITTRRLGTRGHSKYHYYGICIKETSQYYQTLYSGGGLTRFSGSKFLSEGGFTRKYCLSSKIGATLPDFPSCYNLNLPATLNPAKLETLLMMYRTHCQCILDTIISSHFKEVSTYLIHFWQGIPEHLVTLFDYEIVNNLLMYCDTILYNSLIDVLIPGTMQEMSEQLLMDIRKLANSWESWISHSMRGLASSLFTTKITAAQNFIQALRRQSAFIHLAQMVRPVLYDCQLVNQINADITTVQIKSNVTDSNPRSADPQIETDFLAQLKEVLHKQATVEAFTEWLDVTLTQRVVKPCGNNHKLFRKKAHVFFVSWSKFGAELIQEMTAQNAASVESVNLVRLLLDEYIMVAIESQIQEQTTHELLTEIQQFAIAGPAIDMPSENASGCLPASNYNQCMTHIYTQDSTTPPVNVETGLPSAPLYQHNGCIYNGSYQEWITSTPPAYQWSQNMSTYNNNPGGPPFSAMIASTNLPHPSDYEATRKDYTPYYNYRLSYSTERSERDSGYVVQGAGFNVAQDTGHHFPSIGHVFY